MFLRKIYNLIKIDMIYINNSDFKNPKRMFRKLVNK
jgi:hypothetical protein